MAQLLYIECSPRKDRSASIEVSRAFIDAYRAAHPRDSVVTLDVWNVDLPEFDGEAMAAKYAGLAGVPLTAPQQAVWARIRELAQPFVAADKLLFGVPLWNFSIPYRLKHLIDAISQNGVLFGFDGTAFHGLLTGRKALVVYARGLDYTSGASSTPENGYDFQKPYMEMWLRFIGITDVASIVVQKTLAGPDIDGEARAEARRRAVALAQDF